MVVVMVWGGGALERHGTPFAYLQAKSCARRLPSGAAALREGAHDTTPQSPFPFPFPLQVRAGTIAHHGDSPPRRARILGGSSHTKETSGVNIFDGYFETDFKTYSGTCSAVIARTGSSREGTAPKRGCGAVSGARERGRKST